jgi:hypothetical protein
MGGSPHVHLASAEAYIATAGRGEVRTLSGDGEQTFDLQPGRIVWFDPGVIHRLINLDGRLDILVVMQNDGLPEAGDAVMTFAPDVLASVERYRATVALTGNMRADRLASAIRRRDLAIRGFAEMIAGDHQATATALAVFHEQVTNLKREDVDRWMEIVDGGPDLEVDLTRQRLDAIAVGDTSFLHRGRVNSTGVDGDHPGVGMCGQLDAFKPEGLAIRGDR